MIQTLLVPHELLLWCDVLPGVPVADNKGNLSVMLAWKNLRLCGDSGYICLTVVNVSPIFFYLFFFITRVVVEKKKKHCFPNSRSHAVNFCTHFVFLPQSLSFSLCLSQPCRWVMPPASSCDCPHLDCVGEITKEELIQKSHVSDPPSQPCQLPYS